MIYRCLICGHIHNEESTGIKLGEVKRCPVCGNEIANFVEAAGSANIIEEMAISGKSIISSMATDVEMPGWDDILILGCNLNPFPLEMDCEVNARTVIGRNALKPMVIETPIIISHMSYGALSREAKIALAKASSCARTAQGSGEGGILAEEMENTYKYIFEYVPNRYSVNDRNLVKSDAIEIKFGQSTKPGLGGQLEAAKVTSEIAKIRGMREGRDIHSPARIPGVGSKDDLKSLVSELREKSHGRPIGVKLSAGRIESDLEYVIYSGADFVTIDGRGGSTAASPRIIRDSTSLATIYALARARKYLDKNKSDIDLIITGGLRISSDFAKALAMGADAVAVGTSALMALGCRQYRICHTGQCPMGITTQDANLRKRLDIEKASKRVENYLKVSAEELKTFAIITGHSDVHDMNTDDLVTVNSEISDYTSIRHA
ncbi:glutamate synthase-related protein [Methanobrevibacter sp.]|uniref:glutamate synthase-related protein n=1 Tax=Methanobrevibacter sp. TaxID=66852 RepID=UPI00388F6A10